MIRDGILLLAMASLVLGCEHVTGDRITGADLARAIPGFAAIAPDTVLGYAPSPGSKRLFRADELNRIAARYGLEGKPAGPVCFDIELGLVSKDTVTEAMRKSLDTPGIRLEITRLSRTLAPLGEVVFPKAGLAATTLAEPDAAIPWKGYIVYSGGRKFDLWAGVKISAAMTRVVAVRNLAIGDRISSDAVQLETHDDSPLRNDIARHLDEVVGRIPSRSIRAGFPIFRSSLSDPFDVKKGDAVQVRAVSGEAVLTTEALAQDSGRTGDSILLKNTTSGKTFRGRVDGPGSVIVVAGEMARAKRT
jgi:flagella basal body P-ring formation protein FlgA